MTTHGSGLGTGVLLSGQKARLFSAFSYDCFYLGPPLFHIDTFLTLAGSGTDGRYRVLVGDRALAAKAVGTEIPEHSMCEVFGDFAAQLVQRGSDIIRNPLPLVYQDNHITKARLWYFASANNALVEIDGASKSECWATFIRLPRISVR